MSIIFAQNSPKNDWFQDVKKQIPSIRVESRYYGNHNFIGRQIDGYNSPKVYLTKPTIAQLKAIQAALLTQQKSLKIYDGYRPQKAVDHFVRWAKAEYDTLMKKEFYPDVAKKDLFALGYIAAKSGHSRGSTVDVTILNTETGEELDMGSNYDFFGKISWPFFQGISREQKANRMLLRKIMLDNGFEPYQCEWWHFTLKAEPFPATYFDFSIE